MIALVVGIALGGACALAALVRWALKDDADALDEDIWKDGGCE